MEEFIFDDDVDEVGAEVEAHCPKCKADTTHVVVSKYEDEIRRVQCNPCGDVHAYRKPKGEEEEAPAEPVSKKKVKAKPTYDQIMAKNKKPPRQYVINEYFKELEILSHPKFGLGYVTENIGNDKIEVTFKDDKRVLIHNRKNLTLPFLRPLLPTPGKKKGGAKAAARPAAKKPATNKVAAKPAAKKPAAKKPVKTAAKKPVKHAARAAAKKPAKAKPKTMKKKSR